jgi:predicted RNase H-like HicB family nuclease
MEYEFTVVIERDEDGAYIAVCPALPGCHTAGDTEAEALKLIEDAITLHIEARLELGEPILQEVDARKVKVAV